MHNTSFDLLYPAEGDETIIETSTDLNFPSLVQFRKKYHDKLIFGHLNVNSIRYKMHEINMISQNIDILGLTETKLDSSFPVSQFKMENFTVYRKDRNCNGGGLMMYINSSIPSRIRNDLCTTTVDVENIVVELMLNREKMFIILLYKPPRVNDSLLVSTIEEILDKCILESNWFYLIGDFNVDLKVTPNSLSEVFECYNMTNIIKDATCFKNMSNPTLLDPKVTNNAKRLIAHLNKSIGVSDFHNIVCAATRIKCQKFSPHIVTYRSFKKFCDEKFVEDLNAAPFHVCNIFNDVDDMLWFQSKLLTDVIESHAPLKTKKIKRKQVPYMNGVLRKAINVKAMLRRKFDKFNSDFNWAKYKKQRNYVNALKRTSMQKYFEERCSKSTNARDFWQTISPFMSNKNCDSDGNISLYENNQIISDQVEVTNIFNNYFINITKNLSEPDHVLNMNTADLLD
jgi:hypothetical protein